MTNILIPTDFSENSWNATKYALELFKSKYCTFHLLNTYTPVIANNRFMASNLYLDPKDDGARAYSEQGLKHLISRIKKSYGGAHYRFKAISSFNLLVDEIKETVTVEGIDLIVMGTKGASGLAEVFMGSNTVRTIKSIKNCPVLAVPNQFRFKKPKEIAFATDFNRYYTPSELQPLIDLSNTFDAVIRIVHVQNEIKALTELQQFNLNMLRKYLMGVEHEVHTVTELNSVSRTLELFAEEMDIHLLAMLNYQHSYMEQLTREPLVKRLVFHSQIPLLVIPELGMGDVSKPKFKKENWMAHKGLS